MKKLIFEVGANDGREINHLLNTFPDAEYYGFEPTIELYANKLIKEHGSNPNVNFFPIAISDYNGFSKFNIAGQDDWGCSSLFEFTDGIGKIWPGRSEANFKMTHSYNVPIMRLDTFIENYIEPKYSEYEIQYIWIDTQGSDVNVLYGLNNHIDKVKAGKVEVAYKLELYAGTNNTHDAAVEFLKSKGFKTEVTMDGCQGSECDVHFFR